MRLKAIDVINMPREQVMALPTGWYVIQLEDGPHKTTSRRLKLAWFYWQLFKEFPGSLPDESCIIPKGHYHDGIQFDIASCVFWKAFEGFQKKNKNSIWEMSRRTYEIVNEIYNYIGTDLGAYVNTLSLKDLSVLLKHPVVLAAKERYMKGELEVDEVYDEVFSHLEKDDPILYDNELRKGVIAGIFDKRSIAQTVGPRGNVKDINGDTFKHPIDTGYAEGLQTLYDSGIESCSAKRALYMQYGPLEDSEYFNRRIQLHCGTIRTIKGIDCRSKHTIEWIVREDDLPLMVGKNIVLDNGKYHMIQASDKDLIGKTVNVRTYTMCNNSDTTTKCATCVGHNALVLPPKDNLGHAMTRGPCAETSQRILSTKHVEISMEALVLTLDSKARQALKPSRGNKWITDFRKPMAKDGYYILKFSAMEARYLNQVHVAKNVNDLSPSRISALSNIEVLAFDRKDNLIGSIAVSTAVGGVGSSLTTDFLAYLKKYNWSQEDGIITVDMRHWNYEHNFMESPRRNEDVIQFLRSFEKFLFGDSDNSNGATTITASKTPAHAMANLLDLLSPPKEPQYRNATRININFAEAEAFVAAAMARNPKAFDYNMPRAGEDFKFERIATLIKNRSVGGLFAFEGQKRAINDPLTYLNKDRPAHPLDYTLMG